MYTPIDVLESACRASDNGELVAYGMIDATMLNVTLGLFEKAGIAAATINLNDPNNPTLVRFDSAGRSGSVADYWECISAGKMYFYFDDYQMVALITKTTRRKFLFLNKTVYTPYFLTPVAPVLIGAHSSEFDLALDWVEKRYRKAMEVLPGLQAS